MTTSHATVRQERLATRVRGLRARRGALTQNDRWMLVVGGVLVPLGVLLVLLGWLGAARTVLVFEQVPYLISGGVLGLALVFTGGFTYFAYWLTLLVREARTERAQLVAVLERMERLLEEGGTPHAPRTVGGGGPAAGLVATRTGTMIHRPDCVAVDGRDNLRPVTADAPGLVPCRLCDPLGEG
ncbi:MAG: hypothetical protein WCD35_12200 [Mycobacteriales bacterium]